MIYEAIKNFNRQLEWNPEIENRKNGAFSNSSSLIVAGMGGSNLASGLLKIYNPKLQIIIHRNYGLPDAESDILKNSLLVASSYSGNTEETIDAFASARREDIKRIAISSGGKLLNAAKEENTPYIEIPDKSIPPRTAVGYFFKSILKIINDENGLNEVNNLSRVFNPLEGETYAKELSKKIKGFIPIIYSSQENGFLAYNMKVALNETAKTPSFYNTFPELNHNEIEPLETFHRTKYPPEKFYYIFIRDESDDKRILKRMDVLKNIIKEKDANIEIINIGNANVMNKIFSFITLSHLTAYYLSKEYEVSEEVYLIEKFKKLISD